MSKTLKSQVFKNQVSLFKYMIQNGVVYSKTFKMYMKFNDKGTIIAGKTPDLIDTPVDLNHLTDYRNICPVLVPLVIEETKMKIVLCPDKIEVVGYLFDFDKEPDSTIDRWQKLEGVPIRVEITPLSHNVMKGLNDAN